MVCSPMAAPSEPVDFNPRSPNWRWDNTTLSSLANALLPLYSISALKNAGTVKSATRPSAASTNLTRNTAAPMDKPARPATLRSCPSRDDRAMRDEAQAMGESARRRRTGREGRTLREASARVRDGFWYTENLSRGLPSSPPGEPPCRNSIPAGASVAVGCLR